MKVNTGVYAQLFTWIRHFMKKTAAFATCACFTKLLTPPPQHRVDGVSNYTQERRRRRFS